MIMKAKEIGELRDEKIIRMKELHATAKKEKRR